MDRGGVGNYSELSCRELCKHHYLNPLLFIEEGDPQGVEEFVSPQGDGDLL